MNIFHGCPANAEKVALDSTTLDPAEYLQMDSELQNPRSLSASVPSTGITVDTSPEIELLDWIELEVLPSVSWAVRNELQDRLRMVRSRRILRCLEEAFA